MFADRFHKKEEIQAYNCCDYYPSMKPTTQKQELGLMTMTLSETDLNACPTLSPRVLHKLTKADENLRDSLGTPRSHQEEKAQR